MTYQSKNHNKSWKINSINIKTVTEISNVDKEAFVESSDEYESIKKLSGIEVSKSMI